MNCPFCHNPLTQGETGLELTLADLLTGGGAFSELRFREPQEKPVVIMRQADSKPALCCKTCEMVLIISDTEYMETECVVCHTPMPAGVRLCPKCGWTYEAGAD